METSLANILPNLGIGVVAVLCLAYLTKFFIDKLDARAASHEKAMKEREDALRAVEREMRGSLTNIISQTNSVVAENTRVLHRVINHLDRNA